MIGEYWNRVKSGEEVRGNLIALKAALKEDAAKEEWAGLLKEEENRRLIEKLLGSEDPKIRKNAALLAGRSGDSAWTDVLYHAYEAEEQMFVKSSYLAALSELNYFPVLDRLKKRRDELIISEPDEQNRKHIGEELRELDRMILSAEQPKPHRFNGHGAEYTIILTTNRNHIHVTAEALKGVPMKTLPAGLMIRTDRPGELARIRTWREALFVAADMKSCPADIGEAAEIIAGGENALLRFLRSCHEGAAPFYFRLDVKSGMDQEKKAAFIKKLAAAIEKASGRTLINTPSFYELELRLIENREKAFNIVIKLLTCRDTRFSYRKNVTAASIHPVNAALTAALARPYLKERAQILDPFCGVGTMLIERARLVRAGTMYGIDCFHDAVRDARENTQAAGLSVNYINRDFFDFRHAYLFDEMITDMPWTGREALKGEIEAIYRRFFVKAAGLLKAGGVIILYTHDRDLVKRYKGNRFRLAAEYEVSMKEGTHVMILLYQ